MLKMAGVLLLIGGFWGAAYCVCEEEKNKLRLLKEMKYMYQLLQNEIRYSKLPLPEIFLITGERLKPPYRNILLCTGKSMNWEGGLSFQSIWENEVKEKLKGISLFRGQRELLLRLPESIGLSECEGQARALERYIEELNQWIAQTEKEQKNKNKVIMSLGIAGGIFLSILLL